MHGTTELIPVARRRGAGGTNVALAHADPTVLGPILDQLTPGNQNVKERLCVYVRRRLQGNGAGEGNEQRRERYHLPAISEPHLTAA